MSNADKPENPVLFERHAPAEWLKDSYRFDPELHFERYEVGHPREYTVNENAGRGEAARGPRGKREPRDLLFVARVPAGTPPEITRYNYAASHALTRWLASRVEFPTGKVLVKPNNTGFVGLFYNNPALREVMARLGVTTQDADHQCYATQPAVVAGAVDALLATGQVSEIHVAENMLWGGGTPRAFWETGYAQYFSQDRYAGKVFFVDLYEGDDTVLLPLPLKTAGQEVGRHYTHIHPPRALFDEHYDLFLVASIAKVHNCSWYTLAAKNASITWNPRKKQGTVYPRFHAHGLPVEVLDRRYAERVLGPGFEPKYEYRLLGTVDLGEDVPASWPIDALGDAKITRVVLTNGRQSTAPIRTYPSYGGRVLQVDPHHHAGSNLVVSQLGMNILTNRSFGMFASVVTHLRERGTQVACLCSGIVAQEGEGPLVYGGQRYGGFAVAGFNFAGLERTCLDVMFGTSPHGFAEFAVEWNRARARELGFRSEILERDAREAWTVRLLGDLLDEAWDPAELAYEMLDFTGAPPLASPADFPAIRQGPPFQFTESFYCSLKTWLRLMYTEPAVYRHFAQFLKRGVEIPLIPGVVE